MMQGMSRTRHGPAPAGAARAPVLARAFALLLSLWIGATPWAQAADGASGDAPRKAGPIWDPAGPWREQAHWVPVEGTDRFIYMRLCRPRSEAPAHLVVISHGSPPVAASRDRYMALRCEAPAATWFLERGYAVAAPLRRGYGVTGGAFAEGNGRCGEPDFLRAAMETARDILSAVDYARALPGLRADEVVLAGQSAGGWGSLGAAARNPRSVSAVVNMAGGRGGWAGNVPNSNCRPDLLVRAAGMLGRTARIPSLWVYTDNDSFFAPPLAADMHASFVAAGGAATFRALPAFGRDGHGLFFARDGASVWGPVVEAFLGEVLR
jgi:dienelactone hydrolase